MLFRFNYDTCEVVNTRYGKPKQRQD